MCYPAFNIFSPWYLWLFLWSLSGSFSFFFPCSEKKSSSQDAVFFFLCGRLCSQGLIKLPQHHHGDQWWSGMLSTAISHLLLYPQSSSTPPSISHSADALLLILSSSKKKNSTGDFPHAPITSPPLSFFLFHWLLLLNVFCQFLHSSHF